MRKPEIFWQTNEEWYNEVTFKVTLHAPLFAYQLQFVGWKSFLACIMKLFAPRTAWLRDFFCHSITNTHKYAEIKNKVREYIDLYLLNEETRECAIVEPFLVLPRKDNRTL